MNTNTNSCNRNRIFSEFEAIFTADFAGNLRAGNVLKNKSSYCHKTDQLAQSIRINGSSGIDLKKSQELYNSGFYLWHLYSNRMAWMIIKYSHLTLEEYENLHLNWHKFCKKVRDLITNQYRRIFGINKLSESDFIIPWLFKFELSFFRTHTTGLPHFDINFFLLYLDENGNPLFNCKKLISKIYKIMGDVAKDHISIPKDNYFKLIQVNENDFRNWASYFAKPTDPALLAKCKSLGVDHYFPKQWYFCSEVLREEAQYKEKLRSDIDARDQYAIAQDEFRGQLKRSELNKNGFRAVAKERGYDQADVIDRMHSRLAQKTSNIERL